MNIQALPEISARAAPTAETYTLSEQVFQNDSLPRTTPREELILFSIGSREMYGLSILRAIEECSNGRERLTVGSLYPILHALEKKGLVTSRWGDETSDERTGARRRYYQLSKSGRAVIQQICRFQQRLLEWRESSND